MFPRFVYDSYSHQQMDDGLHLSFRFLLGDKIVFEPTATLPWRPFYRNRLSREQLDVLTFNIGMIELVSYWKAACPPTVEVRCGKLSDEQVAFWKKIYYNGLGEFYYVNNIKDSFEEFMQIESTGSTAVPPLHLSDNPLLEDNYLVPIGGGKDSVVTLERLRRQGLTVRPLIMNPRGATTDCASQAGFPLDEVAVIHRTIHPRLLELNKNGCLNGHTPFSAMLAFYTLLVSALTGVPNIALSNESSANESTVAGTNVNHQYSKSLEFENDFRQYYYEFIAPYFAKGSFNYFSYLRPLSELQIAMLFAQQKEYHPIFRSCNRGSKTDSWCCHCPKCLFAYIILSPFIAPEELRKIFGADLLDDVTLQKEFLQLIGQEETKPFECVGTVSEVNSALTMCMERWYRERPLPALLVDYRPQPVTTPLDTLYSDHNVDEQLLQYLRQQVVDAACSNRQR
ncbi:MAG: hypothetical protein II532_03480 [Bacteroidales bacterium]|nr:hypothetical protein [Bacteroidales bacterium]